MPSLTRHPKRLPGQLGPRAGRLLLALIQAHAAGRHPSFRELGRAVGGSLGTIRLHLLELRVAGLVTWGDDTGRVAARTLRPTCTFTPA